MCVHTHAARQSICITWLTDRPRDFSGQLLSTVRLALVEEERAADIPHAAACMAPCRSVIYTEGGNSKMCPRTSLGLTGKGLRDRHEPAARRAQTCIVIWPIDADRHVGIYTVYASGSTCTVIFLFRVMVGLVSLIRFSCSARSAKFIFAKIVSKIKISGLIVSSRPIIT